MSTAFSVDLEDNATPAIEAKLAKCNPQRLRAIVGPALATFTRAHLLSNGTNRRGWPSTHFWADAARGTSWQPVETSEQSASLAIVINKIGVRQRVMGGPIAPVNAKALAIPISPVSYGHVPSDFPNLFLLKTKKGAYLVQRGEEVTATKSGATRLTGLKKGGGNNSRRQRANLNFLFKLAGSVNQKPNPDAVPSEEQLLEVAFTRIEEAVA